MRIEYPSSLPPQEIAARLQKFAAYLTRRGIGVTWRGYNANFRGSYFGVSIVGQLAIVNGGVIIEARDPGVLWRGKAESFLRDQLKTYLG